MELAPPRGTQDLLPDRADAMYGLYAAAHRTAELFGYRYVETPMFEHTELFVRTSGDTSDVVTKEMYTFEDKGGRSLTLRPESTASVVRAYLTHAQELPNPFKSYYVGSEFRHGRPQAGRFREFRQFGIEVIGVEDAAADVEVIVLGERYLRERGLRQHVLHLNSIGDENCRPAYRERLVDYFEPYRDQLDEDCRTRLSKNPLRVFDCKVDGGKDFVLGAPTIADHLCEPCARRTSPPFGADWTRRACPTCSTPGWSAASTTTRGRRSSGSRARCQSDQASTINAGGRYDGLAEALGGQPTPGVGFAMGLDRVLLALEAEGAPLPPARGPRCFVVALGSDAAAAGRYLVADLRADGISAADSYEERPLKAQLKMADRAGSGRSPRSSGSRSSRTVPSRCDGWSTACRSRSRRRMWRRG